MEQVRHYLFRIAGILTWILQPTISTFAQPGVAQVIPPSPNAAIFQKFTDVPVSYYNGLPNINIPIYTIDFGTYKYPISLAYHAGGIRVEDKATWVGLNWALNGVGIISRNILDGADDGSNGFFNNPYNSDSLNGMLASMSVQDQVGFWHDKVCSNIDLEPDIFYLNVGDINLKFYINKHGQVIQINKTDNVIVPIFQGTPESDNYGNLKAFKVISSDGTTYFFGNGLDERAFIDLKNVTCSGGYRYNRTAWFLQNLITAKRDTINFEYDDDTTTFQTRPTTTIAISPDATNWYFGEGVDATNEHCPIRALQSASYQETSIKSFRLKTISFKYGRVEFYASSRIDVDAGNKKLDSIKIFNYLDASVIGSKFSYDYYTEVGEGGVTLPWETFKRLRLLSVTQFNNGQQFPPYKFDYTSNTLPMKLSPDIDHWGFYNACNNAGYMPFFLPLLGTQYGTRSSPFVSQSNAYRMSTDSMIRGTLNKITYPTGGFTRFDFEPNEVYMRDFDHHIRFDGMRYFEFPDYYTPDINHPGEFWMQEVNATPDSAATAQTISLTSANNVYHLNIASNCGYRYYHVTGFNSPNYNGTGYSVKLDINGNGSHTFLFNSPADLDSYYYLLPDGQYIIQLLLLDAYGMPVSTIYDSISATIEIKADILDFCQLKNRKVGGLRLKQLDTYDAEGNQSLHKEYVYGSDQNPNQSSGSLANRPIYFSTDRELEDPPPGVNLAGYFCGYVYFSEKSQVGDSRTGSGTVGYSHVTELYGQNGIQGKTCYDFISPAEAPDDHTYSDTYPFPPTPSYEWQRGLLLKKSTYRYNNAVYQLVQQDSSIYIFNPHYKGLNAAGAALGNNFWTNGPSSYGGSTAGICVINLQTYDIPYGAARLMESYGTDYDIVNNNAITKITKYYYDDSLHVQPFRAETYDSKGNLMRTVFKYPYNYMGTPVYDSMIVRNYISPIIDQKSSNVTLDKELSHTQTNYQFWQNNTLILPGTIQTSVGGNTLETDATFNAYDLKGNIQTVTSRTGVANSYIWDYHRQYPIAEVRNADSASIAYTSFEADGTGHWTVESSARDTTTGITGSCSYVLNSNISKSGLSSSRTYFVSYWTLNKSPFSITGTVSGYPMKGKTINGWTLYVHKLTGQTTITIDGSGHIDELRLYPVEAKMTTYTYQPLVGITSACDIGNRITYYEYDGLQRLKRIRDQDYNIIKTYEYQYQGSSGCGNNCYILTMQTMAGTSTIGYPVGVFNVHGKLLGNADSATQYVSLWNADTADSRIGTLAKGGDPLHFNLTLNTGQALPAGVTGCRYYQVDLAWDQYDGLRNTNAAYVDFGDSTGITLAANVGDVAPLPANTTYGTAFSGEENVNATYYIHTYHDTTLKTITFYHNDNAINGHLDNLNNPATSLMKIKHFRGNLPANLNIFGGSCYQQASMNSIDSIRNWSSIHGITYINFLSGDGINPCRNMSYTQDFMQYNKGLQRIKTTNGYYRNGYRDTTFKLSRLKNDWNTYFTGLQGIAINDDHWDREDLSALRQLNSFTLVATTQNHQDDPGSPLVPIPKEVLNNVLNQIAAGAGQTVRNGVISMDAGGSVPDGASSSAVQLLQSKGWSIYINGVLISNP